MSFDGPSGRTDQILDDVRFELMSLNLQVRDLINLERQEQEAGLPPTINLSSPELDLEPLIQALGTPSTPVDFSPVLEALSGLEDRTTDLAILESLSRLQKSFDDLGVGMRAIAGSQSGGGGAVYLAPNQVMQVDFPAVQVTQDSFATAEYLADQVGADGVLTFTFSSPVQLAFVRSTGANVRAVTTGTPTTSLGAFCGDGESTALPVTTDTVKVYAPAGATGVSVWGFRY